MQGAFVAIYQSAHAGGRGLTDQYKTPAPTAQKARLSPYFLYMSLYGCLSSRNLELLGTRFFACLASLNYGTKINYQIHYNM